MVGELTYPLAARSHLSFRLGRWPSAHADAEEAVRLAEATSQEQTLAHALGALAEVEAALGHDDDARRHATRAVALAQAQGADAIAAYGHGALALLASGRREPEEALERALAAERAEARTDDDEPGIVRYAPDMLEALWRLGRIDEARERLAKLERQADRPGHTWAQAVVRRMHGLIGDDDAVDDHFAAALDLHRRTAQPFETARTQLLFGERLRRARRRSDARAPLRQALAVFERLGAVPWVERTRAELLATGGQEAAAAPGPDAATAVATLTPQELQIALHAARGMTNREVGAALFLAPKTVEHHLSRAFRKLGIRRRVELAGALGPAAAVAA
jgi:DNA-binding CsgD family transcriptional regulator